ncbi:MAG: hypothetical protein HY077_09900 [Elusimicrobia bacterium]|nr:hypothetical protein [Elusimicrobiota bacterium]
MKTLRAACAALLLTGQAWSQTAAILGGAPPAAAPAPGAAEPAYRFVEGISDGVYDFMRLHVIGAILPDRLTRSLKAAPAQDSALLFDRNLHDKEARYLARVRAAYPTFAEGRAPSDAQIQAWRSWATAEQVSVAVDALGDTLTKRYQLELFGDASGEYAKDRRNWDPGFLTMSGILGGTFLYLNGMHATAYLGRFKLGVDIASGLRLRRALQQEGDSRRLAGVELGYKGSPLALTTEWGSTSGRVKNERFGAIYRLRF